jgi:hypothetical protein
MKPVPAVITRIRTLRQPGVTHNEYTNFVLNLNGAELSELLAFINSKDTPAVRLDAMQHLMDYLRKGTSDDPTT